MSRHINPTHFNYRQPDMRQERRAFYTMRHSVTQKHINPHPWLNRQDNSSSDKYFILYHFVYTYCSKGRKDAKTRRQDDKTK